jgi:small subunit ribosomal protein S20
MPNIKSAAKRARIALGRQSRNRAVKSGVRTARLKFEEALSKKDKTLSEAGFRAYCSLLDKGVKKGIITANTAARSKSRAAKKLKALAQRAEPPSSPGA